MSPTRRRRAPGRAGARRGVSGRARVRAQDHALTRRPTVVEGLYTGLGSGAALTATQLDAKMKLLVEAPAAVEDALASLLDHADATLQARPACRRGAGRPRGGVCLGARRLSAPRPPRPGARTLRPDARARAQTRALLTYIKRVYYPFLLSEPELLPAAGDALCVLWVHTHSTAAGSRLPHHVLGAALVLPALDALPAGLAALDDALSASGAARRARAAAGPQGLPPQPD